MTPSTKNWRSRQTELLDTTMMNQAQKHNKTWPLLHKTGGQDKPNFWTPLWWTKHKNTIRHDPFYKKLEVKTNRTSGHHSDEPSKKYNNTWPLLQKTGGQDKPNFWTPLWWTKHKITIRHDPSYKKLEVKTNRTSGHHYDEPSTK